MPPPKAQQLAALHFSLAEAFSFYFFLDRSIFCILTGPRLWNPFSLAIWSASWCGDAAAPASLFTSTWNWLVTTSLAEAASGAQPRQYRKSGRRGRQEADGPLSKREREGY